MDATSITIKRIGGYVVVISLLLLGSVMTVWWVLGSQLATQTKETTALVSYSGAPLSNITTTTATEAYVISSDEIVNGTIQSQDISPGAITKDNLDTSVVQWVKD